MTYVVATRQIDLNQRPQFLTYVPAHPIAMLHHRISWNVLGSAINCVLSGQVDRSIVNFLLRMSPENDPQIVPNFTTALHQVLSGKNLDNNQITAIERIEQLVFSLPCNLFLGLNTRADDPGNRLDFLPGDVNADGTLPAVNGILTPRSDLQRSREQLHNRLMHLSEPNAVADVGTLCAAIVTKWSALNPAAGVLTPLKQSTPFAPADWAPGIAPFAAPPYRHWPGALTAQQSAQINTVVSNRVDNLYR